MKRDVRHIPVLLEAVLKHLAPKPGDIVVDCTVGLGGHAAELLRRISPGGRLIGLDLDPSNLQRARERLAALNPGCTSGASSTSGASPTSAFELHHANFAGLPGILASSGIEHVNGLLADLGVASPHLDDPARGFSFKNEGPLDMRLDPTRGQPASALVNRLSEKELADAFRDLGDEEDAERIARLIVQRRAQTPIQTTGQLNEIICAARDFTLGRALGAKLHPATRTFQALRMMVNREIPNLQRLLAILPDILAPGGTAAIISFHSGEDRRVKRAFKGGLEAGHYEAISPDPVTATEAEQRENPRSRSAKLRWARRKQHVGWALPTNS